MDNAFSLPEPEVLEHLTPPLAWLALFSYGEELVVPGYQRTLLTPTFHPHIWCDTMGNHEAGISFSATVQNLSTQPWPTVNAIAICDTAGDLIRRKPVSWGIQAPSVIYNFTYYASASSHAVVQLLWRELLQTQDLHALNLLEDGL